MRTATEKTRQTRDLARRRPKGGPNVAGRGMAQHGSGEISRKIGGAEISGGAGREPMVRDQRGQQRRIGEPAQAVAHQHGAESRQSRMQHPSGVRPWILVAHFVAIARWPGSAIGRLPTSANLFGVGRDEGRPNDNCSGKRPEAAKRMQIALIEPIANSTRAVTGLRQDRGGRKPARHWPTPSHHECSGACRQGNRAMLLGGYGQPRPRYRQAWLTVVATTGPIKSPAGFPAGLRISRLCLRSSRARWE